jgi:hypothetical protein
MKIIGRSLIQKKSKRRNNMAKTDIHVPTVGSIESKKEEPKENPIDVYGYSTGPDDLATVIGQALPLVIRSANNMPQLQVAIDTFLKTIPEDREKRAAKKREILEQLRRGQLALESMAARVGQSIG